MDKKTILVNIVSSCICRDCFEIGKKQLMKNQYNIEFFFQASSPFSLYSQIEETLQSIEEADLVFGSPWQRRLVISEFRKNLFEKIEDGAKDAFLILDFTDYARDLYRLSLEEEVYLLRTDILQKNESLFKEKIKDIVSPWTLPKEAINKRLDKFAKDISKRYDPKRIVLFKAQYIDRYLSKDGIVREFSHSEKDKNKFLEYCYDYFIKYFEDRGQKIHIIEVPKNALANEQHKWGNSSRHFCDEYYEYLLSAIDCCVSLYDNAIEEEMLTLLLENCQKEFLRLHQISDLKKQLQKSQKEKDDINLQKNLLTKSVRKKEEETLYYSNEIEKIKNSKTYRIGRFFTYIPRKLRKKD